MTRVRGHRLLATGAVLAVACQPPAAAPSTAPSPVTRAYELTDLVGDWRWLLRTTEDGSTRIEEEVWRFAPGPTPTQLIGRYVRSVEVRSGDLTPFVCNQRPWYQQRAVWDVVVELGAAGHDIRETGYAAEPGPCDHGFRHVSSYRATLAGDRLRLAFDGGTQTLWKIAGPEDRERTLPDQPWPAAPAITGGWRWDATSYDAAGNIQDESEWWEIVQRSDTRLDATYRRRVSVRSPDDQPLACAGAPTWSYDDAYVLEGQREEEHWHFIERAADPGDHPCLRLTPRRALDEATAEQLGEHLILEWRGKRRQVLYRPGV